MEVKIISVFAMGCPVLSHWADLKDSSLFFVCKISYFGIWRGVVQLILVGGVWKPPKLTKFGLKFCPQVFGLATQPGVWTRGATETPCAVSRNP